MLKYQQHPTWKLNRKNLYYTITRHICFHTLYSDNVLPKNRFGSQAATLPLRLQRPTRGLSICNLIFSDRAYPPTAYTGRFVQCAFSRGADRQFYAN